MNNIKFQQLKSFTYKSYFCLGANKKPKIININAPIGISNKYGIICKEFDNSYLYIIDGVLITNRCLLSLELLELLNKHSVNPLDYTKKFEINKLLK